MSFEIQRKDDLGERRAGVADSLAEAERRLIAGAARELDSLVCRDRRSVCAVYSTAAVLIVDLRLGRVIASYTFTATDAVHETAADDYAATAVLELVRPAPGRSWP